MAGKPDSLSSYPGHWLFRYQARWVMCVGIVIVGVETQARVSLDVEWWGSLPSIYSPVFGMESGSFE